MPVTLTDEQLAALQAERQQWLRDRGIAEGATAIWNDPELSDQAKALWKKKYPDQRVPEYDAEQRVNARLDKIEQERQEREKAEREKMEDERVARQRTEVQERHKWDDATMKRLEDLMVEKRVADYEVAATYLASKEPAPSEATADYDRQFWGYDRQPVFKEIAADPEDYARREISKTLRDMQARGIR